ncbi:FMRFamide receptor-like [Babylonia areolata]|uniref:FMRFamide receptor-like n=1 Tax=Babylonia areolata TaxID=304850 RepID=UPI003FCFBA69
MDDSSLLEVAVNGTTEGDFDDALSGGGGAHSPLDSVYQQTFLYYLMGIGGLVVCSLGVVANALSVAVLTRRSFRSSTYTYLSALAVCDTLVLVFTVLLVMKDVKTHDATGTLEHTYSLYFPFVHPTAIIFQVTSIWLTLGFTVDRYIMICHPFRAETMCRRSRARKVVVALYMSGIVFCIPKFLEYTTRKYELSLMNSTEVIYVIEMTEIGKNEMFREMVHSWMYLICVCGLPFLTLVVLNAFLIHAVHMSRLKGKELNAREKHRNDTTIMLIGVIVIFLICQGPALVSRMIYAFKPVEHISRADFTLNEVANFLVILNSAINIVPYYFFGNKFRREFWTLFCSCLFDRDELRRLTRTFSLSVDPGRRGSNNSSNLELNGLSAALGSGGYGGHGGRGTAHTMDTPLMGGRDLNPPSLLHPNTSLSKANGHAAYFTQDVTARAQRVHVTVTRQGVCPKAEPSC